MENYEQIVRVASVSVESVWELMVRACVGRVGTPYYCITEDGCGVDVVVVFFAVCVDYCCLAVVLGFGVTVAGVVAEVIAL